MFALTSQPIDGAKLQASLDAPETGALCIFEGRVRNHHLGEPVTKLEYEAFDELAQKEGDTIVSETEAMFPGANVVCVHRTGTLEIGEVAVWIGVASAHRQAGFAACRHVIEDLKRRLPIWKKEHHPNGASEWVNCTLEKNPRASADDYHARQIALPEVGTHGQAALAKARIAIVGIGGLGCPAALYLAGAGIGRLTLIDDGRIERSNLHRQILFTPAEIGSSKALVASAKLRDHNPAITISPYDGRITEANARALLTGHDVVLDCTDNFAARFLVHDTCWQLGIPLVQAAVHRFEGTLDVFQLGHGGCLHCQWGEVNPARIDAENCASAPVFAPAVGALGLLQASEAIKLLIGLTRESSGKTTLLNLLDNSMTSIARPTRPNCPVCAAVPPSSVATAGNQEPVTITRAELSTLGSIQQVDLDESVATRPAGSKAEFEYLKGLDPATPIVLVCDSGIRSAALARLLRAEGRRAYALPAASVR